MPASDVPGWQLGYRFNAANFAGGAFADLTGNGNPMVVLNGAPVFETVDTHDGVKVDNTWNARFWHPNAWQGTVVLALRMERLAGGTLVKYMADFSRDGGSGTAGRMVAIFSGNNRNVQLTSSGARTAGTVTTGVAGINVGTRGVAAMCQDQERLNTYWTADGTTVSSGTASTGTTNGNLHQMRSNVEGAYFGSLTGNTANTTADTTVNIHAFELHFFEGNPLLDAATELQAYLAELQGDYT